MNWFPYFLAGIITVAVIVVSLSIAQIGACRDWARQQGGVALQGPGVPCSVVLPDGRVRVRDGR